MFDSAVSAGQAFWFTYTVWVLIQIWIGSHDQKPVNGLFTIGAVVSQSSEGSAQASGVLPQPASPTGSNGPHTFMSRDCASRLTDKANLESARRSRQWLNNKIGRKRFRAGVVGP